MITLNELYHHGVKGQKWGVRRYQNADGTLTSLGKTAKDVYKSYYKDEYNKTKQSAEKKKKAYEDLKKSNASASDILHAGKQYLSSHRAQYLYKKTNEALDSDSIKVGKDYIADFKKKKFTITKSGFKKFDDIAQRGNKEYLNKNRKLVNELNDWTEKASKEK